MVFAAVVAGLYAGLTLAVMPLSYGAVQFRISEVLCILPFFFPFSVWGLFVGCIISNIFSPYFWLDITVGPAASLLAALCTMYIGQLNSRDRVLTKIIACFPPVIFNALFIGAMISYIMISEGDASSFMLVFLSCSFWVGLGQLGVMYLLGLPLMIYLPKTRIINNINILIDTKT